MRFSYPVAQVLNAIQMLLNLYLALMYGPQKPGWGDCSGGYPGPPGPPGGPPGGGGEVTTYRPGIPPWVNDPDLEINFEDITPPTRFVGRRFPLAAKSRMLPYSVATEVHSMLDSPGKTLLTSLPYVYTVRNIPNLVPLQLLTVPNVPSFHN